MSNNSEVEAMSFSDDLPWDPMNSDTDVMAIEKKMRKLNTEQPAPILPEKEQPAPIPQETIAENKDLDAKAEEEANKKEEWEADFGDAEKVIPTEGEDAAQAAIPLNPRNFFKPGHDGTSDGEVAVVKPPNALVRSKSIPLDVGLRVGRSQGLDLAHATSSHPGDVLLREPRRDQG